MRCNTSLLNSCSCWAANICVYCNLNLAATDATSSRMGLAERYSCSKRGYLRAKCSSIKRVMRSNAMPMGRKSNSSSIKFTSYARCICESISLLGWRAEASMLNWCTFSSQITALVESGELSTRPSNVLQRLSATYVCPWANECCASMMACSKVSPWLLCMVTAHANRRGNCLKVPSTSSSISCVVLFNTYLAFVHSSGKRSISSPVSLPFTVTPRVVVDTTLPNMPL